MYHGIQIVLALLTLELKATIDFLERPIFKALDTLDINRIPYLWELFVMESYVLLTAQDYPVYIEINPLK